MGTPSSAGGAGIHMIEADTDLRAASETAVRQCLDLRPDELLVVIAGDKRERTGEAPYEVIGEVTDDVTTVRYPPGNQHGEELPVSAAAAMQTCDAFLTPAAKSLSHTRTRGDACDADARSATLPGVTEEAFVASLDIDYDAIYDHNVTMFGAIGNADELRVTTEKDTDITFVRGDREWLVDTSAVTETGPFSDLPVGEIPLSPAFATGTYAANGTMIPHGFLDEGRGLRFEVEDSYVTETFGDDIREQVETAAEETDDDVYNLTEISIGANVGVTDLVDSVLLDEKATGTVHIAADSDAGINGDTNASPHLGGIIREPAVYADGEEVDLPRP